MVLNKFVIGVQFNKHSFRLASRGGDLIDEILELRETNKKLGSDYLSRFSASNETNNMFVKFADEQSTNQFTVQSDQFIFAKTAPTEGSSVSIDKVVDEFKLLWKTSAKILRFPDVRRLGMVGEYLIDAKDEHSAANELLSALVNWPAPKHSGNFKLDFEDRELTSNGAIPESQTDDYWNTIYSFFPSDRKVEDPIKGKINANLDVQKYYNPAISDPLKELAKLKGKYQEKKRTFKTRLGESGLIEK